MLKRLETGSFRCVGCGARYVAEDVPEDALTCEICGDDLAQLDEEVHEAEQVKEGDLHGPDDELDEDEENEEEEDEQLNDELDDADENEPDDDSK